MVPSAWDPDVNDNVSPRWTSANRRRLAYNGGLAGVPGAKRQGLNGKPVRKVLIHLPSRHCPRNGRWEDAAKATGAIREGAATETGLRIQGFNHP